ncbi:MAG: type II secretion system protein [Planctomycetes bacterium]|nr:type II secretion system protein [Planctomycetota bacterium]
MSEKKQKQRQANGFTLIELLVVISIIVLLLGILVPGMRAFKRTADNLKQKSRFHSMEVGLELYYKDFLKYPESKALPAGSTTGVVNGAHHLAEALFGRDMKGFDYKSNWYALTDSLIPDIYANDNNSTVQTDIDASAARRKGPYVDLKDVGAFRLNAGIGVPWYPGSGIAVSTETGGTIYAGGDDYPSPVISDIFYKKIIKVANLETGVEQGFRVGTPVLYFKANTDEKQSRGYDADGTPITDYRHLIYNYEDNEAMFGLPQVTGPETDDEKNHHYRKGYNSNTGDELFYDDITNEKVEQYARPVNARSFLLISAGRDGIYGTDDDVTNFGK